MEYCILWALDDSVFVSMIEFQMVLNKSAQDKKEVGQYTLYTD